MYLQLEIYGAAHTKVGVAEEQDTKLPVQLPHPSLPTVQICIKREEGLVHFVT